MIASTKKSSTFVSGDTITYFCNPGYSIKGYSLTSTNESSMSGDALCQDGFWVGIKDCEGTYIHINHTQASLYMFT